MTEVRRGDASMSVVNSFTTEALPMYGSIYVGGGAGDGAYPEPPRSMTNGADGPSIVVLAWTDERSPETLALYPPNDRAGMDIVTIEEIEGSYLGHHGTGAETVFTGRLSVTVPHISVGSITGPVEVVTFRLRPGRYRVWVAVADRQQSILAWERWLDEESDDHVPSIERWWVTLQLVE